MEYIKTGTTKSIMKKSEHALPRKIVIGNTDEEEKQHKIEGIELSELNKNIDKFIDMLEKYLGINVNFGSSTNPIYLKQNVYIIDHLYDGTTHAPFFIEENEDKIKLIENHPHYGVNVYTYKDSKNNVDIFYDATSLKLTGYKKTGKEYTDLPEIKVYLQTNYSLVHKIRYLGFPSYFVKQKDSIPIVHERLENLKKTVDFFIRSCSQIKNFKQIADNYKKKDETEHQRHKVIDIDVPEDNRFDTYKKPKYEKKRLFLNDIIIEYSKKIGKISLVDFSEWRNMEYNIISAFKAKKSDNTSDERKYIKDDILMENDTVGNYIINYLLDMLKEIFTLPANNDKKLKEYFANFIIQLFNYQYQLINIENDLKLRELQRYKFIIYGNENTIDTERKGAHFEEEPEQLTEGIYEEAVSVEEVESQEYKDKKEKDQEREDAVDIDMAFGEEGYEDDDEYYENDIANEWDGQETAPE